MVMAVEDKGFGVEQTRPRFGKIVFHGEREQYDETQWIIFLFTDTHDKFLSKTGRLYQIFQETGGFSII